MTKRMSRSAMMAEAKKQRNIQDSALRPGVHAPIGMQRGALPVIARDEVHCPVCGYGAVNAMTLTARAEDRTLFLHRGRAFPCRSQDLTSIYGVVPEIGHLMNALEAL